MTLLAQALLARGVDVRVAALFAGGPRVQELIDAGVPVWIGDVPRKWQVWRLLCALVRFMRLLRALRPDVVHAFLLQAYVLAGPLARLARVPVLVAGRRSLGTFLEGRPLLKLAERVTTPAYSALVANARAVAADTLRRERVPPERVHVIPNALPETSFDVARGLDRPWSDPVRLLCVANLIDYKGHRYLLDALTGLDRRVHLELVGEGPERAALEQQAAANALDVVLLGARTDVTALLAAADVFVLPSLEEGMSNALMEAMAAGLPAIATDVGGNREVLDGVGVLCRAADPGSLRLALQAVLADEDAARALGGAARRRALERYRVDALAESHLALYRKLWEARCAA